MIKPLLDKGFGGNPSLMNALPKEIALSKIYQFCINMHFCILLGDVFLTSYFLNKICVISNVTVG